VIGRSTLLVSLSILAGTVAASAQEQRPEDETSAKSPLRDSLDGALDFSDWLIDAGGFIPVPIVISEPALGDLGAGFAPVFLQQNAPIERDGRTTPVAPDITAVGGAYTANGSWFAGAVRVARIDDYGLRYTAATGYANINMDFYDSRPEGEDVAVGFHASGGVAYGRLLKDLRDARFTAGLEILYGRLQLELQDDGTLPPFATDLALDSVVAAAGPVFEFDGRDSTFSPDRGIKVHGHFQWSDDWLGSDYRYGLANAYLYAYLPVGERWARGGGWTAALRIDWQHAIGDPPFYLLPFVELRGVPSVRYQGRTTALVETEQRIDFNLRWSAVAFGGVAKAFAHASEMNDAEWIYNAGAGFRYLLARKFKLRAGLDVARGPEEWAYYIVFGSAWTR
jgi:hypothetical protein